MAHIFIDIKLLLIKLNTLLFFSSKGRKSEKLESYCPKRISLICSTDKKMYFHAFIPFTSKKNKVLQWLKIVVI